MADCLGASFGAWGNVRDAISLGYVKGRYVHPEYPRQSRVKKEEGTVLVGIEAKNGKIAEVKVVRGSGSILLDNAAVHAIEQWEFENDLSVTFVQPITFRIE